MIGVATSPLDEPKPDRRRQLDRRLEKVVVAALRAHNRLRLSVLAVAGDLVPRRVTPSEHVLRARESEAANDRVSNERSKLEYAGKRRVGASRTAVCAPPGEVSDDADDARVRSARSDVYALFRLGRSGAARRRRPRRASDRPSGRTISRARGRLAVAVGEQPRRAADQLPPA